MRSRYISSEFLAFEVAFLATERIDAVDHLRLGHLRQFDVGAIELSLDPCRRLTILRVVEFYVNCRRTTARYVVYMDSITGD